MEFAMRRKWFVGTKTKRLRIPFALAWMDRIPQPRWLKRLYYRFSFWAWGHPSNHHWKMFSFGGRGLLPGERDLFSGAYCIGDREQAANNKHR